MLAAARCQVYHPFKNITFIAWNNALSTSYCWSWTGILQVAIRPLVSAQVNSTIFCRKRQMRVGQRHFALVWTKLNGDSSCNQSIVMKTGVTVSAGHRSAVGDGSGLGAGLAALTQPLKLHLTRAPHEEQLRDYSMHTVLIEPLASVVAVEDFLWPRVMRTPAQAAAQRQEVCSALLSSAGPCVTSGPIRQIRRAARGYLQPSPRCCSPCFSTILICGFSHCCGQSESVSLHAIVQAAATLDNRGGGRSSDGAGRAPFDPPGTPTATIYNHTIQYNTGLTSHP